MSRLKGVALVCREHPHYAALREPRKTTRHRDGCFTCCVIYQLCDDALSNGAQLIHYGARAQRTPR